MGDRCGRRGGPVGAGGRGRCEPARQPLGSSRAPRLARSGGDRRCRRRAPDGRRRDRRGVRRRRSSRRLGSRPARRGPAPRPLAHGGGDHRRSDRRDPGGPPRRPRLPRQTILPGHPGPASRRRWRPPAPRRHRRSPSTAPPATAGSAITSLCPSAGPPARRCSSPSTASRATPRRTRTPSAPSPTLTGWCWWRPCSSPAASPITSAWAGRGAVRPPLCLRPPRAGHGDGPGGGRAGIAGRHRLEVLPATGHAFDSAVARGGLAWRAFRHLFGYPPRD